MLLKQQSQLLAGFRLNKDSGIGKIRTLDLRLAKDIRESWPKCCLAKLSSNLMGSLVNFILIQLLTHNKLRITFNRYLPLIFPHISNMQENVDMYCSVCTL